MFCEDIKTPFMLILVNVFEFKLKIRVYPVALVT